MTVDELIKFLEGSRQDAAFGGNTVVYIMVPGWEYQDIQTINNVNDEDGGVVCLEINPLYTLY